jgi:inward rectifier potassium channel
MGEFKNKDNAERELGFGSKVYKNRVRFFNKDGSVNVKRSGLGGINNVDIYNWLISASLLKLINVIILSYILINIIFAGVYYSVGAENFGGMEYNEVSEFQKFIGLFFFSAQTITTLGYGHIYPRGNAASIAAAVESLLGLLSFALATGVLYGRFSRPSAHILYSKNILFAPYKNTTALMFRIVNQKQYELIELEATLNVALTQPGTLKRDFLNLELEVSRINFMPLSWTIVHAIDEKSPLYGLSLKDFEESDAEIIILIKAINDTYSQTVYSRNSYKHVDMVDKAKFKPLKQEASKKGKIKISVTDIHAYDILETT